MLYAAGHMAHLVGRCSQPRLHQSLTEAKHAWEACQHPHQQCLAEQCIEALMYAPHPCAPPSLAGCCCATAFITHCAAAAAAWFIDCWQELPTWVVDTSPAVLLGCSHGCTGLGTQPQLHVRDDSARSDLAHAVQGIWGLFV